MLGATERAAALEREIFQELRQELLTHAEQIRETAAAVGELALLDHGCRVRSRAVWLRFTLG